MIGKMIGKAVGKTLFMAGVGAGMMYLFDPQRGAKRRALLHKQTKGVLGPVEAAIENTEVGQQISHLVSEVKPFIQWVKRVENMVEKQALPRMREIIDNPSSLVVRQQRTSPAIPALFLVAGAGVGAGVLYFFDPDQGSWRRAALQKRISQLRSQAVEQAPSPDKKTETKAGAKADTSVDAKPDTKAGNKTAGSERAATGTNGQNKVVPTAPGESVHKA